MINQTSSFGHSQVGKHGVSDCICTRILTELIRNHQKWNNFIWLFWSSFLLTGNLLDKKYIPSFTLLSQTAKAMTSNDVSFDLVNQQILWLKTPLYLHFISEREREGERVLYFLFMLSSRTAAALVSAFGFPMISQS